MSDTSIQWTDKTWNPVRGCSLVSPGCRSCYAMKQAHRFNGPGLPYEGLTKIVNGKPVWTGEARPVPEKLTEPLSWRKPQRVFVNSMSDLFHKDVPDEFIDRVFAVMKATPRHTYQILTKRPERMLAYMDPNTRGSHLKVSMACDSSPELMRATVEAAKLAAYATDDPLGYRDRGDFACVWPLPNVWLGVSVEDQARADERIPLLLQTPAAVRFLSCEPLLEPVNLEANRMGIRPWHDEPWVGVDWVIVGGESGPGSRPFQVEWGKSIVDQCQAAGVPVFVKQLGSRPVTDLGVKDGSVAFWPQKDRKGGDPSEWPDGLNVRQFPVAH
jgi:protein gp37